VRCGKADATDLDRSCSVDNSETLRGEEVELLRRRAQNMLRLSEEALRQEMYDTAAFLAEQAARLFIKHKILELTGEMPRTTP
jgi:HEPN domain-containing protein